MSLFEAVAAPRTERQEMSSRTETRIAVCGDSCKCVSVEACAREAEYLQLRPDASGA